MPGSGRYQARHTWEPGPGRTSGARTKRCPRHAWEPGPARVPGARTRRCPHHAWTDAAGLPVWAQSVPGNLAGAVGDLPPVPALYQ